jgi:hypothetical protein
VGPVRLTRRCAIVHQAHPQGNEKSTVKTMVEQRCQQTGGSTGGTLTLLLAECSSRFCAAC